MVVCPGPELTIQADGAQLDQLLINLVRNAVDATCESDAEVEVSWVALNGQLEVWVRDGGPGLADTDKSLRPVFHHQRTLTLANRDDRGGCEARLSLPIAG
jgi:C4-dicarboxylate-specific signal transduction histidine kinase